MPALPVSFPFRVRQMQEKDLDAAHEIDQLSFPIPWPASSYRYELEKNTASITLVAEETGSQQVIGFIVIWLILDEAHIANIAVHPDHRRLGAGRELLAQGLKQAIGRGATSASLEVRSGNTSAQALYREFGLDVVGRRAAYYKDNGEDALLMSVYDLDQGYLDWLDNDSNIEALRGT
jgi:[ribosomal protein S18]-alanine N-acetyltransferase